MVYDVSDLVCHPLEHHPLHLDELWHLTHAETHTDKIVPTKTRFNETNWGMDLGTPTEYAQSMPNAKSSRPNRGLVRSQLRRRKRHVITLRVRRDCVLGTPLNTIVDALTPIDEPICVIAWNSAPATLF